MTLRDKISILIQKAIIMKGITIFNFAIALLLSLTSLTLFSTFRNNDEEFQHLYRRVDSVSIELHELSERIEHEICSKPDEAGILPHDDYRKEAQISFNMARQAEDSNDAFIYCMNALQKDARNYDYYIFMSALSEEESDAVILEQIEQVMELGLYQVPADKVAPLSTLLKNVRNRIKKQESEGGHEPSLQSNEEDDTVTLLQSTWCEIEACHDAKQVSKLCSDRLELLQELAGDGHDYSDEIEKTVARTSYMALVSNIRSAVGAMKISLSDFKQVPESSLPSLDIAMQGINGQLAQLCMQVMSTKPEYLPDEASAQKDNLCADVESCRILLGKAKSIPTRRLIEQVKRDEQCSDAEVCAVEKMYKDANAGERGSITKEIDCLVIKMRKLTLLVSRLEDKEYAMECATYLAEINNTIAKKQKERMKAYQIWTLTKCNEARERASKETNNAEISAAHAAIKYHLRWVDISLLAPETADIYQTVLSTYKREAGKSEKISIENEIVETEKHSLERM